MSGSVSDFNNSISPVADSEHIYSLDIFYVFTNCQNICWRNPPSNPENFTPLIIFNDPTLCPGLDQRSQNSMFLIILLFIFNWLNPSHCTAVLCEVSYISRIPGRWRWDHHSTVSVPVWVPLPAWLGNTPDHHHHHIISLYLSGTINGKHQTHNWLNITQFWVDWSWPVWLLNILISQNNFLSNEWIEFPQLFYLRLLLPLVLELEAEGGKSKS